MRRVNALSTSARAWSADPDRTPVAGQVGQHVPGQLVVPGGAVALEQRREVVERERVVAFGHRDVRRRLPAPGRDPAGRCRVDRGQHGRDALSSERDVTAQCCHGAFGGEGVEPVHLLSAGQRDLVALVGDRQRLVPPPALDADPGEPVERRGARIAGRAQSTTVGRAGEEAGSRVGLVQDLGGGAQRHGHVGVGHLVVAQVDHDVLQARHERILVVDLRQGGIDPEPGRRHDGECLDGIAGENAVHLGRESEDLLACRLVSGELRDEGRRRERAQRGQGVLDERDPDGVAQRLARGVVVEGRRERERLHVGGQPEQLRVQRRLAHPADELLHPDGVACVDRGVDRLAPAGGTGSSAPALSSAARSRARAASA